MKQFLLLAGISGLLLCTTHLHSQVALATWNFDNATTYLTASSFSPLIASAPVITYGSGVTDKGAGGAGNCSGTNTGVSAGYSTAFDANDYLEFTLTPAPGQSFSVTSIVLNMRANGTGPETYVVRSGDDGFASDLFTGINEISHSACTDETATIGVSTSDPILFRIYFYGAGNGAGELSIDNLTVNTSVILPVRLLSFNAVRNGNSNKIVWEVADEANLIGYTVERSTNGKLYEPLGKVSATGSLTYNYTDIKPGGVNYYRLVVNERSGASSRGKVVSVVNESNGVAVQLLPSIINSTTVVALSLDKPGMVTLGISDMSGRSVLRTSVRLQTPSANIPLNLSNLKSGMYNLLVETETGKRQTLRFVKQ